MITFAVMFNTIAILIQILICIDINKLEDK